MKTIRVLTKTLLTRLNRRAIVLNLNRSLRMSSLKRLPDTQVFPVTEALLHNDDHMRVTIILNEAGDRGVLDISLDEFNKLPTVQMP